MRWESLEALEARERSLLEAARGAAQGAVCGYSGFPVGAAVLARGEDGQARVVTGSNFETINYRSVCAEKHAVMRALAELSWRDASGQLRRPEILAVAVYCAVAGSPQQPCGDCRQMLHEVNPRMQVLAWAGPGRGGAVHDPRVTRATVEALLPHGFDQDGLLGQGSAGPQIVDDQALESYVVHLPRREALARDAAARTALLVGVNHLILVGSPARARRVAQLAHERFGAAEDADAACYCDLSVAGRDETQREFAVYAFGLPGGARVAVASHGIGEAGAEIVLGELPALIALAQGGESPRIQGVLRCGTRGTLRRVPLGCVALSTEVMDEGLDMIAPDPAWLARLRAAASARGMTLGDVDALEATPEAQWLAGPGLCVEGAGISARFFWEGQGRPLYRPQAPSPAALTADQARRAGLLARWRRAGISWVEMEDYAVLRVSAACGYPAATLGAVIAHRRSAEGVWQLDYSKEALAASELLPAELALAAIAAGEIP